MDLRFSEGVAGVAGPSGVGKSTLLATFATLRRPHVGELEILGADIGNVSGLRSVRARIGYLPGRCSWAENLSASEFVSYAAYYKRVGSEAARSILKRLELNEAAGTELRLLPPDVRLRAGLAATCVHEPELVILDDPLEDLAGDPATVAELVPLIRALAPTVVVSASAAETLTGWCDRVTTLARGKLTDLPTHRRQTAAYDADGSPALPRQTVRGGASASSPRSELAAAGPAPRARHLSGRRAEGDAFREDREAMSRSPLSRFEAEPPGEDSRPREPKKYSLGGRRTRGRAERLPAGSTAGV
ncbi:ATP-binding cassette domain-containing protein [Actinomadura barringtoniae]|uniref:ATP-binding cassette domain-containing protein n=1 Tax=Actinomadura barringtoniae TaxID=1427535 RepID=UPI0027DB59E4|nr:ATP-binding cassette domain-containing protein [Actinomadura barringtoniae]